MGREWQGLCMARGMHGGGVHGREACMAGGHVWQGGGMCAWWMGVHGRGPPGRYYKIRSMSEWYVSYWNAFLLIFCTLPISYLYCLSHIRILISYDTLKWVQYPFLCYSYSDAVLFHWNILGQGLESGNVHEPMAQRNRRFGITMH